MAQAQVRLFAHLDFDGAEAALRRAVELDPNSFDAHYAYGVLSMNLGYLDRGVSELGRAVELNPTAGQAYMMLGRAHLFRRDYEQAIAHVRQSQELLHPPSAATAALLSSAYWQLGRRGEAAAAAAKSSPAWGQLVGHLAAGRRAQAVELVAGWDAARRAGDRQPHSLSVAYGYAMLGAREKTLQWLQRAYAEPRGRQELTEQYQRPKWDLVRADPRFRALLRGVGLPRSPH